MSSGDLRGSARGDALTLPRHLYVHVPVCRSKCAYCDFCSVRAAECAVPVETLALHLLRQAEAWLDRGLPAAPLRTLYVGGGTPTILGGGLPFLVRSLLDAFGSDEGAEVTVEANPESLDGGLLAMLPDAGVTRVSLGVQSCNDEELAALGRPHDASSALDAAREVLDLGLELSVDLMCGIPEQTARSWDDSLRAVLALGLGHVSVYPLSLEEGTPLAKAVASGAQHVPGEDEVAAMLEHAASRLEQAGLQRYEVANFARPGRGSRHNTAYWTGAEYLAVGPSASGMLSADTAVALGLVRRGAHVQRVRYMVPEEIGEGTELAPPLELELLDGGQARREDAMLGMRTSKGIGDALAEEAGALAALRELEGTGLVKHQDGRWALSERGWLLGNVVFERMWCGDNGA